MRIVCVIPARGGSLRVPGKNIYPLCGKPVISYAIDAARHSGILDRVIVSTDDADISAVAKAHGADVIKRPSKLATADAAIDDALRHVVSVLRESENFEPDIVVLLQANNPVRKEGEIDLVVKKLIASPEISAVATAYQVTQRPEWAKVVKDKGLMLAAPYMDAGTKYRMQDLPTLYLLDGSVIALRSAVLEQTTGDRRVHAYMGSNVMLHMHDRKYATEIDEYDDIELAEYYLMKKMALSEASVNETVS